MARTSSEGVRALFVTRKWHTRRVTYIPDLSQYTDGLLSVGWLDADHLYPTGDPADGFADALLKLIASPQDSPDASDECDLCGDSDLGTGEIHVEGPDGTAYAAPVIIHHYVVDHGYLPPEEFQQAVLAAR